MLHLHVFVLGLRGATLLFGMVTWWYSDYILHGIPYSFIFISTSPTIFFLFWPFDIIRFCPCSKVRVPYTGFLVSSLSLPLCRRAAAATATMVDHHPCTVPVYSFITSITFVSGNPGRLYTGYPFSRKNMKEKQINSVVQAARRHTYRE